MRRRTTKSGEADPRLTCGDISDPPVLDTGGVEGGLECLDTVRAGGREESAGGLGVMRDRHEVVGHL